MGTSTAIVRHRGAIPLLLTLVCYGCQEGTVHRPRTLSPSSLDNEQTLLEQEFDRLKNKGVSIPIHIGTVDDGKRVVARGSGNITYFSGSAEDLEPLTHLKSLKNLSITGAFSDEMMAQVIKAQGIEYISLKAFGKNDLYG